MSKSSHSVACAPFWFKLMILILIINCLFLIKSQIELTKILQDLDKLPNTSLAPRYWETFTGKDIIIYKSFNDKRNKSIEIDRDMYCKYWRLVYLVDNNSMDYSNYTAECK